MLINEVCKECNLTKKAVEYYAEQGLIQPRITENGYRQFSETDALKLKRIAVLRGLGFSVPEIRTILENDSRTAIYDVLNRKEFEIVELQTKQALIKQLAESGDWEHIEGQVEALQNKQSISDFTELGIIPFLLRREQLIECVRGKREVALSACHRLTPPS